jgi:hypothetical protein
MRFHGWRKVGVRLDSGEKWTVVSPVFLKAKPQRRGRGRPPARRKDVLTHLGLEYLGALALMSPGLVGKCVAMATLCPSLDVASQALRGLGVKMNPTLLWSVVSRFGALALRHRADCHAEDCWRGPGLKVLVCGDGGRARGRQPKRGKRAEGLKRQGYHSDWFAPWVLTITVFGPDGKRDKSIPAVIDGSCGDIDAFFALLELHLRKLNLAEADEVVFCADNGAGLWTRFAALAARLGVKAPKFVLDYTHAKQNMAEVAELLAGALKLDGKAADKLRQSIGDMLWQGDIPGVRALAETKLAGKGRALKAALAKALRKLDDYFADPGKFQYAAFRGEGLPTGSGSVESAVRRVINLRIKSAGMFWRKEHAELMLFLRSLVLTGKLENALLTTAIMQHKVFESNNLCNAEAAS